MRIGHTTRCAEGWSLGQGLQPVGQCGLTSVASCCCLQLSPAVFDPNDQYSVAELEPGAGSQGLDSLGLTSQVLSSDD